MSDKSPEQGSTSTYAEEHAASTNGSKNGAGSAPRRGNKQSSARIKQLFVDLEAETNDSFTFAPESITTESSPANLSPDETNLENASFPGRQEIASSPIEQKQAEIPVITQPVKVIPEANETEISPVTELLAGTPEIIPEQAAKLTEELESQLPEPEPATPVSLELYPDLVSEPDEQPVEQLPEPEPIETTPEPATTVYEQPELQEVDQDFFAPERAEEQEEAALIHPLERLAEPQIPMALSQSPPEPEQEPVTSQPVMEEPPIDNDLSSFQTGSVSKWVGVQSTAQNSEAGEGGRATQEEDKILRTSEDISPTIIEGLRFGRPVAKNAQGSQPAVLAYAKTIGETPSTNLHTKSAEKKQTHSGESRVAQSLLLEVMDEDPGRTWSEDELLLVEQVSDQLSLALENARLFEESRARAEQLSILNEMSRNLSAQLDMDAALETVYRYSSRLIDTTNFYVAIYLGETNEVTFPLTYEEGKHIHEPSRPLGNGLTEYIFRTRQVLLIKEDVVGTIRNILGIELIGREPLCWMGVPLIYSNQVIGVIAVQSYKQSLLYDESHRDLLTAIASQAAVAIENARLYTEERRRRQIADALSDIARTVSSTLEVSRISGKTLDLLAQLVDYDTAAFQLIHDGHRETIGFRRRTANAQPASSGFEEWDIESSVSDDQLIQAVVESHQPLALANTHADSRWHSVPENAHIRSWLAAPLLVGDQVIGVLVLEHIEPEVYSSTSIEMVSIVAAQVAVGIQNANLFEQTQKALSALAVSERYQKNVAQAVAALTERGMAALSDVLRTLGEATKADRVYYIETQVDSRGAYWRLTIEWCGQGILSQLSNPALRRLMTGPLAPWIEQLRVKGYVAVLPASCSPEQKELLESLGSRSLLQIAVPGRHEIPGWLGFDQTDASRKWSADEISALQTAASALASTISREDLFTQVQINLAETEALYQASARLNSAKGFTEILNVLRQHTMLGQINASEITLNLFDRPWIQNNKPDWMSPVARWSAKPDVEKPSERTSLSAWQFAETLLQPERPTVVMDISTDPRMDDTMRSMYADRLGAKSLVYMPLNVSGRWIGHIIAAYNQNMGFPEQELRRLSSLAGQSAVAIESLRLLDETRQRNEELASINQITSAASRTLELNEVLAEILIHVLKTIEYESGLISITDPVSRKLQLAVHENLPEKMVVRLSEQGMDGTPCDLVYHQGKTIYAADLNNLPGEILPWQSAFNGPKSIGFNSYLGVPLESKGIKLGTVCAFNRAPKTVPPLRITLMEAIGQQVGVVVDNARLFQNTQIALSETETLYQASAELNAVQSYDEILNTLRKYSILSEVDYSLSLDLFDHPWIGEDMPEKASRAAFWSENEETNHKSDKALTDEASSYFLGDFPATKTILRANAVVAVEEIDNDPRLDKKARMYYTGQHSLICAPLVVGGLWIGFLHAVFSKPANWQETDLRRLDVLAGQAAVAAQTLRQLRQIQMRAQYEYKTREIGSQISATIDRDTILGTTARSLCQALNASHVHIGLTPSNAGYLYCRNEDRFYPSNDPQSQSILQLISELPEPVHSANSESSPEPAGLVNGYPDTQPPAFITTSITLRGEHIGDIQVLNTTGGVDWSEDDLTLIQTIGSQVALSLDNARLFQETQVALTETETLHQASAELNSVHHYDDIVLTLRKYTILGEADSLLSLCLFNRAWFGNDIPEWVLQIASWSAVPDEKLAERYALSSYPPMRLLSPDEPTLLEDLLNDPRVDDEFRRLYIADLQASSALFVPLVVGGVWLGFLNGVYSMPTHFGDAEMRRVLALANQAAVAIQNLRLLEESQRRASQLQTAAEIARDTSSTLALDTLMARLVYLVRERFDYYHASIFLLDETGTEAVVRESTGEAGNEMKRRGHKLAVGSRSIIGQVTLTGRPLVLNDVTLEEAKSIHRPNPLLPLTRAEMGIPLKIGDRVIGALDVQSIRVNAFSEDDVSVLQILADQIAVAVDNARSYELTQKAVEEIREADRLKSQFLANMSHELRTPLNSIIGFSRVILKGIDGPISDLQQQDLTAIYNSGQHLLGLINDVLDLSKIEAGKMELAFEDNINLGDIIRGVMSTTVGLVKDKPIELKQIVDPGLPTIRLDPMKVRQVLLNLLSNASKFTERGSITVEANMQSRSNGEAEVIVRVIDTGHGIAPDDQVKLFQPFSQVDGSLTRKTGGSGLGLSICQHLVSMHNGRIGLTSQVGKGTTFFFTLPVNGPGAYPAKSEDIQPELPDVREKFAGLRSEEISETVQPELPFELEPEVIWIETPPVPEKMHIGAIAGPGWVMGSVDEFDKVFEEPPQETVLPAGPPAIILAIESDPQVVGLYRRYLDDQNYTIIALAELEQTLTVVRGIQPFAITLDVAMVGSPKRHTGKLGEKVDGWKVLQALKTDPYTRQVPIIVCTMLEEQERAMEMGANGYLMKPILEEEFRQAIRRVKGY